MKTTMDYMVGNTAIQIINKGNKIKVVDVKKEKVRRRIVKHLLSTLIITAMLVVMCFYVVRMENQKVLLDKAVFTLQSQIDKMEKNNIMLQKEEQEEPINYNVIYKKALALGMKFPTNEQMGTYSVEKSTTVRVNGKEKSTNEKK